MAGWPIQLCQHNNTDLPWGPEYKNERNTCDNNTTLRMHDNINTIMKLIKL